MEFEGSSLGPFAGGSVLSIALYLLIKGLVAWIQGKPEVDRKKNKDRREEIIEIQERESKSWHRAAEQARRARIYHSHAGRLEGILLRNGIEPPEWPNVE